MSGADGPPSPWNLPNAITLLRIALVPVFAWLLLADDGQQSGWRVAAWGAFTVAVLTDRLDGALARRQGLVTNFGTVADPIADKALVGTALVLLSLLGELAWWVTVVVVVREVAITVLRFVMIRTQVMPAGRGGKAKTASQALAISLYLLPLAQWFGPWAVTLAWWTMLTAVVLTVASGVDYVAQAVHLRRGPVRAGSA